MWRNSNVMLQGRQSWKLCNQIRNALTGLCQVFEYQSDRRCTIVSKMNFRHRNTAAAFAAKHAVVFDQSFGDICLAHGDTNNAATMTRSYDIDCTRSGNVCDDRAALSP